ncbi:thioesterase family protein [Mycobacterium sp. CPCC 205372]|uniref:Thioesterase family protein n=1 Tax=Mycobacterium hippophais TaxID=3016340 RepID=A0ABT4PZP1_9MYCO|nr:acyl-CoA thioesterase domain-containing protein [Mycobacterium hippophais]MCZ8381951.1 thioesterase family protein [Mycobacterium hippophais]
MSRLLTLLDVQPAQDGCWTGAASGPAGKRSFGGQFAAQSLAAAARTVDADRPPTNMHLQFLRGGEAGDPVDYTVTPVFDGRTAAARRVDSQQGSRLLTTATVSFAAPIAGPEHGRRSAMPAHPDTLPQTGPPGPAPSLPLDELDIRIADERSDDLFVRRMWWRATVDLPDDPLTHTLVAVYVTDLYMIDPALQVHGHSMQARTHRSGTTDSSIWFHQPVRADHWNLLESSSPAAARGRAVITASLVRDDGVIAATLVQEGLIANRE